MPFWLINSPIHIKRAVPAVSVNTTRATRGAVNLEVDLMSTAMGRFRILLHH